MIIPNKIGKLKKCKGCRNNSYCRLLKFDFNFVTCEIDCYWKYERSFHNGNKFIIRWYKNNQWHRVGGPAIIEYQEKSGRIKYKYYYENGIEIDEEVL